MSSCAATFRCGKTKKNIIQLIPNSELGRMYLTAHRASANHGFANRAILTNNIRKAIKKVFGKEVELSLVYDMPHVYVQEENILAKKFSCTAMAPHGPLDLRELWRNRRADFHPLFYEHAFLFRSRDR